MNIFGKKDTLEEDARSMTDCNYVMNKYLLEQYLLYRYRELFAFIISALLVIPTGALHKLLTRCTGWQTDAETVAKCKHVINPEEASKYLKESFDNKEKDKLPKPTLAVVEDDEDNDKKDKEGKSILSGVSSTKPVVPSASNEVSESFSNPMLTGTPVCKNMYAPLNSKCAPGCMQDDNMRKTACLGLEPTSDINYPGGGAYQVQSAATVQNRLKNNNFLPGNCLDLLQG